MERGDDDEDKLTSEGHECIVEWSEYRRWRRESGSLFQRKGDA